ETHPHLPPYPALDGYRASGGYKLLQACLGGKKPVEDIIKALEDSGLRGLGGAGFPTGRKWRFVRQEPGPRLMAVNADEGEPGTFKDRYFLETDPHRFLEGTLIGAWAAEAEAVYIYLCDEYPQCHEILAREIAAIETAGQARNGRQGLRTFSVSGRVKQPGVKLAPAGITARQLIDEFCGGMAAGHSFKGYLPGGASGGILPASLADIPLDFGTLEGEGCFIGSAAVVVLSDKDDMKTVALNLLRFFEDESCGQCTPCRVGTEKAVALMNEPRWDEDLLAELTRVMSDASICGLGQAAMNPVKMVVKHFRDDLTGGERA